jgi:TRAP-type C4-dicarboxylate transport system permease small subunit
MEESPETPPVNSIGARVTLVGLTNGVALIGAVGILLIASMIVFDVLMRWLFNAPILGVDDISKFSFAVVISCFFPTGLLGGHFVTIRFLGKALGSLSALWLEVIGATATLFVFILFAWQFLRFTLDVTETGLATIVLELPQAPWWWIVTLIMGFSTLVQIAVFFKCLFNAVTSNIPVAADDDKSQDYGI